MASNNRLFMCDFCGMLGFDDSKQLLNHLPNCDEFKLQLLIMDNLSEYKPCLVKAKRLETDLQIQEAIENDMRRVKEDEKKHRKNRNTAKSKVFKIHIKVSGSACTPHSRAIAATQSHIEPLNARTAVYSSLGPEVESNVVSEKFQSKIERLKAVKEGRRVEIMPKVPTPTNQILLTTSASLQLQPLVNVSTALAVPRARLQSTSLINGYAANYSQAQSHVQAQPQVQVQPQVQIQAQQQQSALHVRSQHSLIQVRPQQSILQVQSQQTALNSLPQQSMLQAQLQRPQSIPIQSQVPVQRFSTINNVNVNNLRQQQAPPLVRNQECPPPYPNTYGSSVLQPASLKILTPGELNNRIPENREDPLPQRVMAINPNVSSSQSMYSAPATLNMANNRNSVALAPQRVDPVSLAQHVPQRVIQMNSNINGSQSICPITMQLAKVEGQIQLVFKDSGTNIELSLEEILARHLQIIRSRIMAPSFIRILHDCFSENANAGNFRSIGQQILTIFGSPSPPPSLRFLFN